MPHPFEEFRAKRQRGNEKLLSTKNLVTKRFISLDKQAFSDGALKAETKELMALAASMVLRCNDCIDYHLQTVVELGFSREEIDEALGIAMLIGGTIVIPHARHAAESLDFLFNEKESSTVDSTVE